MSLRSESELVRVPLSESISSANDTGIPVALSGQPEEEAEAYDKLAEVLTNSLFNLDTSEGMDPSVLHHALGDAADGSKQLSANPLVVDAKKFSMAFDAKRAAFVVRQFSSDGASETLIDPQTLRASNPKSGEPLSAEKMTKESEVSAPATCKAKIQYYQSTNTMLLVAWARCRPC